MNQANDFELNRFALFDTPFTKDVEFSAVLAFDDMPIFIALDASHRPIQSTPRVHATETLHDRVAWRGPPDAAQLAPTTSQGQEELGRVVSWFTRE